MLNLLRESYNEFQLKNCIVWQKTGNASLYLQRLLIFAHYDPKDKIQPYVVHYLKQLALEGFSILFVTAAEKMAESEVESITPYCAHCICKKNTGFDFGSWKVGLWIFDAILENYEAIILANDSCYAPAFDWTPMFGMFQQQKLDICGVTFNTSIPSKKHVQPYFLWINHTRPNIEYLRAFFKKVKLLNGRELERERSAIDFTQNAIRQGLQFSCWVNNKLLADRYQIENEDATQTQPLLLLRLNFSPFIKKSIFLNPSKSATAQALLQELQSKQSPLLAFLQTST